MFPLQFSRLFANIVIIKILWSRKREGERMSLNAHHFKDSKKDKMQKRIARIIIFLLTTLIMGGLFFLCHSFIGIIHDKKESIFFSGGVAGYIVLIVFLVLSGFIVAWTLFTLKYHIVHKSFSEIKGNLKIHFFVFGVLFILMLPFLVLGFDNYVVVNDEHIYYSRFWTLGEKEYSWGEDVSNISLHYSRTPRSQRSSGSVSYKYMIHFTDGNRVDVWADVWDGSIDKIKLIDEVAQKHHIPFNVESRPSDEKIIEAFEGRHVEFVRELFSR